MHTANCEMQSGSRLLPQRVGIPHEVVMLKAFMTFFSASVALIALMQLMSTLDAEASDSERHRCLPGNPFRYIFMSFIPAPSLTKLHLRMLTLGVGVFMAKSRKLQMLLLRTCLLPGGRALRQNGVGPQLLASFSVSGCLAIGMQATLAAGCH